MKTLVRLATAYCPDVPSSREGRGCKLHGVLREPETASSLGETLCGILCNEPEFYPRDLLTQETICGRCLRNSQFSAQIREFLA